MNRKNNNDIVPSSAERSSKVFKFEIERKTLLEIIILIILMFLLLGCAARYDIHKEVKCRDSFSHSIVAPVSAESSRYYWVMGEDGKLMEFSKGNCSIIG